jgi:hypothetical protein
MVRWSSPAKKGSLARIGSSVSMGVNPYLIMRGENRSVGPPVAGASRHWTLDSPNQRHF